MKVYFLLNRVNAETVRSARDLDDDEILFYTFRVLVE